MSLVQIRIKDAVFSRMLEIVLSENKISVEKTDSVKAKIPDGCQIVITDLECANNEVRHFDKTVFILKNGETPLPDTRFLYRPFLIDTFVFEITKALFSEEAKAPPSLTVDKNHKTVRYGNTSVSLTETELKLLLLLYENRNQTVLSEDIVQTVFGGRPVENSNVAAVYVNYLRKKLDERFGKKFIFSVRGKGYMLKG